MQSHAKDNRRQNQHTDCPFYRVCCLPPGDWGHVLLCQPKAALMGEFYRKNRPGIPEAPLPVITCWQVTSLGLICEIKELYGASSGSYILGIFMTQEYTILQFPKAPEIPLGEPAGNSDRRLGQRKCCRGSSMHTLHMSVPFKPENAMCTHMEASSSLSTSLLISTCMQAQSLSHVWLCNPIDCSPSGSSVCGISQARILEWVAISFFRGSSWPRDQNYVSCVSSTGKQILYHWATWEAQKAQNSRPPSSGTL